MLESEVFIALLSQAAWHPSMSCSKWVLVWASPKKLLPVLVGGLTTAALRKPLDGINAVSASNESDVDDLLIDAPHSSASESKSQPFTRNP